MYWARGFCGQQPSQVATQLPRRAWFQPKRHHTALLLIRKRQVLVCHAIDRSDDHRLPHELVGRRKWWARKEMDLWVRFWREWGVSRKRGCQQQFMPMNNMNGGQNGDHGAVMPAGSILGEYVEAPELSRDLGISKRTLDRWHRQRMGPPRTVIGRTILYRRTAVQEWLRSREERRASR